MLNVGEYGPNVSIAVGVDEALTGLSLILDFTRQDGTTFTGVPIIGTEDRNSLLANQYCVYQFEDGDLSVSGSYSVVLSDTTTGLRKTNAIPFTVNR